MHDNRCLRSTKDCSRIIVQILNGNFICSLLCVHVSALLVINDINYLVYNVGDRSIEDYLSLIQVIVNVWLGVYHLLKWITRSKQIT